MREVFGPARTRATSVTNLEREPLPADVVTTRPYWVLCCGLGTVSIVDSHRWGGGVYSLYSLDSLCIEFW